MYKRVLLLLLLIMLLLPSVVSAASNWDQVVQQVDKYVQQSLQAYQQGDVVKAKDLLNEAYFGPFESERMEQAIRIDISSKRAAEIEFQYSAIRKKMTAGADFDLVKKEADALLQMLRADAKTLQGDQKGTMSLGFYSFLIIVREGIEAILIIAAIAAYLVKSGNGEKTKEVYRSAIVAVLASLIMAYLFQGIFKASGLAQEVLEGAVLLLATFMLFSMSYWMFSKSDEKRWKHYIEGKVHDSISQGKRFALWFAVFLAVFREGAETVLFYQALFSDSDNGGGAILTGISCGAIALIVLFYLIRFGSVKLPLKLFFIASGSLMYVLAFVFAGNGIKELQASGIISNHVISGFSTVGFLGIYPSWEGVGAQMILVLLLIMAVVNLLSKKIKKME